MGTIHNHTSQTNTSQTNAKHTNNTTTNNTNNTSTNTSERNDRWKPNSNTNTNTNTKTNTNTNTGKTHEQVVFEQIKILESIKNNNGEGEKRQGNVKMETYSKKTALS